MSTGISAIDGALFMMTFGTMGSLGGVDGLSTRLMRGPNMDGPRIDDLRIQISSYGAVIPLVWGAQNRIAGNVIWSTGLIEAAKKKKAGGKGGGGATQTEYSYRTSAAILLSGRKASRINRIWANKKLIFDVSTGNFDEADAADATIITAKSGKGASFSQLRFHKGTMTQAADTWMESYLGAGNTPAYRGLCYVVVRDLQLADFGNALPTIEFELVAEESVTLHTIVQDLAAKSGVELISTFMDDEVLGYTTGKSETATDVISPLEVAFDFNMAEQHGQIRAQRRSYTIHATIGAGSLAARVGNTDAGQDAYTFSRGSTLELPREVAVSYVDPAFDFETSTQVARRSERDSTRKESVELPVVLTADQARSIAGKFLWQAWAGSREIKFSLSDAWSRLVTGHVVAIEVAGAYMPFRITKLTRGDNGVWDVDAVYEDSLAYLDSTAGGVVVAVPQPDPTTGVTDLYLFNSPLLREVDDGNGYHWGVTSPAANWRGASVQRSVDGGITYAQMSPVAVKADIGDVVAALPDGTTSVWDLANTLTVTLRDARQELESTDELAVLGGANSAWLGKADGSTGEIIQWRDAMMLSEGVYQLSGLLRGRLGTDHATASHVANEVFVVLDAALGLTDFGTGDWYLPRSFKPVTAFQSLVDTAAQAFTNDGERRRPKSPVHPTGVRDGSNNLTISWIRRTRIPFTGIVAVAPLGEASEAYEVDVMSGATVKRTLTASTPTVAYSAAEQTADGFALGAPITFRIYQLSETRGRGHVREATI